ncbi:MAG: hypothetical protein LBB45_00545 [Methanobrevibacter sp.]|jgi:hypothetical protein|nr:hypothetical protein [Candidatus Methanovirga basalitermitum]
MIKLWKILVIPLILIVLVSGVMLTGSHSNKLFLLNSMKPIDILDMEFLYSNSDKQDANGNNYTVNYYRISFKTKQNIKNMSIVAIGLDQNNRQLTLPDSIILPKTQPFNYIVHSNNTLSKGRMDTADLIYASKGNQNIKALRIYVYNESNRLNNLVSEYSVPVTINKSSDSKNKYYRY